MNSRTPLLIALLIALLLSSAFSLTLYFNENLRKTTFAMIEEVKNENGEIVKRVKVEKPRPNREQVREIARNQEIKKRENLKENARKMRNIVGELEEAAEARRRSLESPDAWDMMAARAAKLKLASGTAQYYLGKNRFLGSQPGLRHATATLVNRSEHHADHVRVLSFMEEVPADAARIALDQGRQFAEQALEVQQSMQSCYTEVQQRQQSREQKKLESYIKQRFQESVDLNDQAQAYWKDLEDLVMNKALPDSVQVANGLPPPGEESPDQVAAPTPLPTEEEIEAMDAAELYQSLQAMTERMDEAFAQNQAAELAQFKHLPLKQAREEIYAPKSDTGPDLDDQLAQNLPETPEQFQAFNEALSQAVQAADRMRRQAESRRNQAFNQAENNKSEQAQAAQLNRALQKGGELKARMAMAAGNAGLPNGNVQDMRGLMQQNYGVSGQGGGGTLSGNAASGGFDGSGFGMSDFARNNPKQIKLGIRTVLAQALPGRRFDMKSKRKGWIFIDTWYIIGPWELPRANSFDHHFPPETLVDLGASYAGKIHPWKKKPMQLRWHFVQSESLRINPPDELSGSVYYAYTEVFCESAMDVVVAVASDDRAKLWINDLVVFQDEGLSGWRLDEGFRRILLKPGYNKLLVRLENGPAVTYFSVLMCPFEALEK